MEKTIVCLKYKHSEEGNCHEMSGKVSLGSWCDNLSEEKKAAQLVTDTHTHRALIEL